MKSWTRPICTSQGRADKGHFTARACSKASSPSPMLLALTPELHHHLPKPILEKLAHGDGLKCGQRKAIVEQEVGVRWIALSRLSSSWPCPFAPTRPFSLTGTVVAVTMTFWCGSAMIEYVLPTVSHIRRGIIRMD
jgi:hypothetical protein